MDTIALEADPASAGSARRFVSTQVVEHHLDPAVAVLLTSELVTNVIRHARTEFTVVVRFDGAIRVEVHDGQAATEAFRTIIRRPPIAIPTESARGRGLGLVRVLASRFGLADERGLRDGKVVWFELDYGDVGADGPESEE